LTLKFLSSQKSIFLHLLQSRLFVFVQDSLRHDIRNDDYAISIGVRFAIHMGDSARASNSKKFSR
jgi:hypothetical protein